MKNSRSVSWIWVAAGLFGLLLVTNLGLSAIDSGGAPHVAVVTLSGVISDTSARSLLGGSSGGTRSFTDELQRAVDDPSAKAIVLRINSPGGAAAASQEMYHAVMRARQTKPIIASMGDVAASGGYYLASACNKIYANPATTTGSIGVISEFLNYQELFRKIGLDETTLKSGAFKDAGSPTRPLRPEEKQLFQNLIRDIYLQFVDDVVAGRKEATQGKLTRDMVLKAADGRVYTGVQAKKLLLVDELGGLYDAVQGAGKIGKINGKIDARDVESGGGIAGLFGLSSPATAPLSQATDAAGAAFGTAMADAFTQKMRQNLQANSSVPQAKSVLVSP